jgi:hypothetical protein
MKRFQHTLIIAGFIGLLFLMTGCASTTIDLVGPPGTVMTVDNTPYHLPAQVSLARPSGAGSVNRYPVSLASTVQSQEVRAKGHIDVFGYNESDVDKLATNTLNLDEEHLSNVQRGTIVIFKGQSASRQPLYELTLGKE